MPQRPLGKTGLTLSIVGLGTVKFGRNQKTRYSSFELPDDRTICALLEDAHAMGINLLDTAPAYGSAEERLGKLLGPLRDRFVIVTKTGEEFDNGVSSFDFSAEHTRRSVERSLRRLRLTHLDCVLAHCPHKDLEAMQHSRVLETLQELKERGDIRSFGASINTIPGGLWLLHYGDVLMATHSAEFQGHEPAIRKAAELGKGVLIKKGLASGNLATGGLEEAMRPIFALPGVSSLVIGTINRDHLRENVRAARAAVR